MQECLNKGVDVNTTTAGNTCLHLAVFQPKPGLIKLLLEKGVDAELGILNLEYGVIYCIKERVCRCDIVST